MCDKRYMVLNIPDTDMYVSVKLDEEGVVLDIFTTETEEDEVVKSSWKGYNEFGLNVEPFDEE